MDPKHPCAAGCRKPGSSLPARAEAGTGRRFVAACLLCVLAGPAAGALLALVWVTPVTAGEQSNGPASAAGLVTYTEDREPCAVRSATRQAYFGDLHIHTGYSYDVRPLGITTTPADAYRFARGQPLDVGPFGADGRPLVSMQLHRPLDFAAVTDHSEFLGELSLCLDRDGGLYDQPDCRALRDGGDQGMWPFIKVILAKQPQRIAALCGADGAACREASESLWQTTREMAEAAYDRSSRCSFTSFVAYEHTGTPEANNYHRNVIFRNAVVPDQPISYVETPTAGELWDQLEARCLRGLPGCDVLAIPHNSNLSAGSMFPSFAPDAGQAAESAALAARQAARRNAMEPVMEIFQHKGNSECINGLPDVLGRVDELCELEQVRAVGERVDARGESHQVTFCAEGEVGQRGFSRFGCISRNDFYRSVLLTGLRDATAIGVNSYQLGVIGSTDTHLSLAGATGEAEWQGHLRDETTLAGRLRKPPTSPRDLDANPGGLAGVWAVENSRDALFEALRRREVFGTSGTRIQPRLFGGWNLDAGACERPDMAAYGYAAGVPMGSDLPARPAGAKLRLLAAALRDPDGAPLQKLQVVKGWVDAAGGLHYQVTDVAGDADPAGSVDLQTGRWEGRGAASLCAVFEDSDFDPARPAYYYLRVVEVPTLRWSWAQCVALPAEQRPAGCVNEAPKTIQELAWSSPVWFLPARR